MPRQTAAPRAAEQGIISVSQLNRQVAGLLERSFPLVWVAGELSNFVRAASGHCYFTLKDAGAQARGVMFRSRARALAFEPREGDQVEVLAQLTLYQSRGDFQLGVEQMRRAGAGDLYRQFMALRARLDSEGLFDAARKREPVPVPRAIGVVTSPHAAALKDVLTTLARRAPHVPVILYPAPVQGVDSPAALVGALAAANRRAEVDVLLLVRGGGSIEDLWSFNDERVARAVFASEIPVIAGVGHESDVTIVDFVADVRAPTPTGAAMLAATDRRELSESVLRAALALRQALQRRMQVVEQRLDLALRLLRPPSAQWAQRANRLQMLARSLHAAQSTQLERSRVRLDRAAAALRAPSVSQRAQLLQAHTHRLTRSMRVHLDEQERELTGLHAQLALVSPQAVLERGYAIVRTQHGAVLRDASGTREGALLGIQLARSSLHARVQPDPAGSPQQPDLE